MFDILGFGYVSVDDMIYVDAFPAPDAKAPVRRAERHCGGLTATALVAAARLGSKCAYAGVLGTDELSTFAANRLREEGIDFTHARQMPEAGPVHSVIVVGHEPQTRNIFFDTSKAAGVDDEWPEKSLIQSVRVLFVDTCGVGAMIRAARLARAANIPVVADLESHTDPEFAGLLEVVDHLVLSQSFAREITGATEPAKSAQILWSNSRQAVVITCGAEGCWHCAEAGRVEHHPAFKVQAVDTTGCGDVFHGAYASALARGVPLAGRIRFASAAAALKATRRGGQAGIPTRGAVETFLQEQPL